MGIYAGAINISAGVSDIAGGRTRQNLDGPMARGINLVRQDASGIWLAAPLAAQKSGLTKPELFRRASAGELAYRDDLPGRHWWYREDQITLLVKARGDAERAQPARPKVRRTDAQVEARHTRQWKSEIARERSARTKAGSGPGQPGPIANHLERAMLHEIAQNNAKRNGSGSDD